VRPFNPPRLNASALALWRQRPICEQRGKARHKSRGAALAHLRALQRRFGETPDELEDYPCQFCNGGWHLGRRRTGGSRQEGGPSNILESGGK
jgi:hypothetical protein